MLIFLDKKKLEKITLEYLNINLTNTTIVTLLSTLMLFYIIKNIIQSRIIVIQSKFIYSISTSISEKLMSKFIYENYTNYISSDKNVFFRDVFQLPMTFATNILFSFYNIFSETIILLFIVLVGLIYNPIITFFSFTLFLSFAFLILKFQKSKVNLFNDSIVHLYRENVKNVMNVFYGFVEIKTTKSEQRFNTKFNESNQLNNNQLALLAAFKQSNSRYFEILFIIGLSFAILFFIFSNNINSLILLSFFAGASIKIIPSFNKILNAVLDIKANKNVVEILDNYQETNFILKQKISFINKIELKKINFNFNQKELFKDINFEINKGDFILLSGKSGQGKSTLLHIISGLFIPKNGKILIDDLSIESNQNLFPFIGYASQQPFLFQGSLLENITMLNNNEVDYEYINEILSALDLTEWISKLSNGLNTPLLLESKKLSGGQKQRIALARALYFKPQVLLLDEVTNQLDEALEHRIFDYLNNLILTKKLTIIAVSHGEKAHQFANKKYNLENGILKQYD